MIQFTSKFLRKPTTATTIMTHAPTVDAAKTTTSTNHLHSRLMQERLRRSRGSEAAVDRILQVEGPLDWEREAFVRLDKGQDITPFGGLLFKTVRENLEL